MIIASPSINEAAGQINAFFGQGSRLQITGKDGGLHQKTKIPKEGITF
jgi:hypothetical protein